MTTLGIAAIIAFAASPAATDPIGIFDQVCLEGTGSFGSSELVKVGAGALSEDRRRLIGMMVNSTMSVPGDIDTISAQDVLGSVFELRARPGDFLIIPAAKKSTELSSLCAVVMNGDRYFEAKRAAARVHSGDDTKISEPEGHEQLITLPVGDHFVTAARTLDRQTTLLASMARVRATENSAEKKSQ